MWNTKNLQLDVNTLQIPPFFGMYSQKNGHSSMKHSCDFFIYETFAKGYVV